MAAPDQGVHDAHERALVANFLEPHVQVLQMGKQLATLTPQMLN